MYLLRLSFAIKTTLFPKMFLSLKQVVVKTVSDEVKKEIDIYFEETYTFFSEKEKFYCILFLNGL